MLPWHLIPAFQKGVNKIGGWYRVMPCATARFALDDAALIGAKVTSCFARDELVHMG
jgi:hypothetical protein